jgi:sarcosine oxidase
MYDLAVIGLGLIGSGALRHGAERATVVGIGPAEPPDWPNHRGPFASHYDSGRITRRLDAEQIWAVLASRAIAQYPLIEKQSGLRFHYPSGLMFVRRDEAGIANLHRVAKELGIELETVGAAQRSTEPLPTAPGRSSLSFPAGYTIVAEPAPAGAIDPRTMIEAQHRAAQASGADIVREAVTSIEPTGDGFVVTAQSADPIRARRILIAAGAYTNSLLADGFMEAKVVEGKVPEGLNIDPLATAVRPEVIVKGRIGEAEARRLADMPSVIYLLDNPELDDVYVVPPMQYPDGQWYIKIGGSHRGASVFDDPAAMNRWMSSDIPARQLDALRGVLTEMLPAVDFLHWEARPCLISDTASGLPYVDIVADGVTVAAGGNGHAAKSADAIGAVAVDLALTGRWNDQDLDANRFAARHGAYTPPAGSRHGN